VKKRIAPIAQLLQTYCRLAELELAAGGRPRFSELGDYGLPEGTAENARAWAGRDAEKEKPMEGIAACSRDPTGTLGARWPVICSAYLASTFGKYTKPLGSLQTLF
jgi:hypothetical protein